MSKKNTPNPYQPNMWGALQNAVNNSTNKGQLPVMGAIVLLSIILLRIPSEKLYDLSKDVIHEFANYHLLGWFLALLELVGFFILSKKSRKDFSDEMTRVSSEKKKLQEQIHGKKLGSSNH